MFFESVDARLDCSVLVGPPFLAAAVLLGGFASLQQLCPPSGTVPCSFVP